MYGGIKDYLRCNNCDYMLSNEDRSSGKCPSCDLSVDEVIEDDEYLLRDGEEDFS